MRSKVPFLRALRHRPWPRSSVVAPRLDQSQPVEEQNSPYYDPQHFYAARIGDVLNERYQLATKLGHGSRSTVWLARDLKQWKWLTERYVAIKIKAIIPSPAHEAADGELNILRQIAQTNRRHPGWVFVRRMLDTFTTPGQCGNHTCLVFEPLREPLWLYQRRFIDDVIPLSRIKIILQMVLLGLDYLHSECHIIHTDLKPDNIMVKLEDPSILERDAEDEFKHPLPQKHCEDGRVIYLARNDYGQFRRPVGVIRITDLDLAVSGDILRKGCIQAELYRAPEVILDVGYSYSADIWSLGVMLWDLIEGSPLFKVDVPERVYEYDDQQHLGMITALLGDSPQSLLKQGDRTSLFYNVEGRLHNPDLIPTSFNFETTISNVSGEEKKMFINFVQKMIRWLPSERSTANELLKDPWLELDRH
ncbi:Serine/threonine-protein kinase SRPK [Exophiala dermatitidis]|uniref:non-specific serine/threonine protein kinase n=1 Tax=Exophiala dermatitidis (strain ATCC 34100 / CBS 525.76 / NIH/UT8656) TaxID=858893 RepID=H6CB29_EXODN|nr:non-specific serine/threonine protein kinase [Exophiala dermatitidis NIH/UT8656]EHY60976.1 non-specific serine/threonine protein kinase [Exophiala dermatitidis NIH/UT8656]